jgi:hypothetical protein
VGAWAIVTLPDGTWRYEIMDYAEIEGIRGRSKSKDSGPWVTDADQMRIKTVIRRILKLYCDDPAINRAMELDEDDYRDDAPDAADVPVAGVAYSPASRQPATKSEALADRLTGKQTAAPTNEFASQSQTTSDDDEDRGEKAGTTASSVVAAQILNAATPADVARLYDAALGPDSAQEFTLEESNIIAAARDKRLAQLKPKPADAGGAEGKDALFNKAPDYQ